DPRWSTAPDAATGFVTRSIMCVPLASRGRPVGVLEVVNRRDGDPFAEEDLELLSSFAAQAAIAVENARLYEKTDVALSRRLHELATIEEIDHELGTSLDYDRIVDLVLRRAVEACQASNGSIGILAEDGSQMEMRCCQAAQPGVVNAGSTAWPVDDDIVGRVVDTGEPALLADVPAGAGDGAEAPGTRSEVVVPIRREERVIGVLKLESARPAAFGQDDVRFLEHLVDHAAIALENARMFQQERQRVQMLSAIGEIGREIRASLDLERTLALILSQIKNLVDYYIAEICLWNEAEETLSTRASAGDARYTEKGGGTYHLDEGFTGWIARHQQVLLIPDVAARLEPRPKIDVEEIRVRAYVGLPLRVGETFVGTLELASDRVGSYTEADLEILQIIADQAAVAIQNARLYRETEESFEQTQLLLRVSEAIGSTLDLTEAVRLVAREMCQALDADMAGVYLADEKAAHLKAVAGYRVPKDSLDLYRSFAIPIVGHAFVEEAWAGRRAVHS
ncbi:MAG TPA: GAF domain-containing protein, partial [Anaerolineae bacterium]|nr:GAF domain-containing protein [Anaerolineae bacterium]